MMTMPLYGKNVSKYVNLMIIWNPEHIWCNAEMFTYLLWHVSAFQQLIQIQLCLAQCSSFDHLKFPDAQLQTSELFGNSKKAPWPLSTNSQTFFTFLKTILIFKSKHSNHIFWNSNFHLHSNISRIICQANQ